MQFRELYTQGVAAIKAERPDADELLVKGVVMADYNAVMHIIEVLENGANENE